VKDPLNEKKLGTDERNWGQKETGKKLGTDGKKLGTKETGVSWFSLKWRSDVLR
jgi:hypothetical protein